MRGLLVAALAASVLVTGCYTGKYYVVRDVHYDNDGKLQVERCHLHVANLLVFHTTIVEGCKTAPAGSAPVALTPDEKDARDHGDTIDKVSE